MRIVAVLVTSMALAACTAGSDAGSVTSTVTGETTTAPTTTTTTTPATTTTTIPTTTTTNPFARPEWLGTRPLPLRPDGHGETEPTPDELVDRRLVTIDLLDPPASSLFESTIEPVPPMFWSAPAGRTIVPWGWMPCAT